MDPSSMMMIVDSLEQIPLLPPPVALTIGVFDGVHQGHRFLFTELKKRGKAVVITFSNHPSEILRQSPTPFLCTLQERLKRIEEAGIDLAIVLEFTKEFSREPYDAFLKTVKTHLPFSFLIGGEGMAFGKGNLGNQPRVEALGEELDFQAIYLPKLTSDNEPISSQRIRELLAKGEEQKALSLL